MKNYQYTEKKVQFNGREVNAIFPKNHSRLKGLIFEWFDANYDGYSNISNWVRYFGIMEKGSNKWKMIEGLAPDYRWAKIGLGIFNVLHGLEKDNVRNKIETEDRIKEIKEEIKHLSKELKEKKIIMSKLQGEK